LRAPCLVGTTAIGVSAPLASSQAIVSLPARPAPT
jgi:hypothetical protein